MTTRIDVFKGKGAVVSGAKKYDSLEKSENTCSVCKKQAVIHPKTKSEFCPDWEQHKKEKVKYAIIKKPTKAEEKFDQGGDRR